MPEPLDIAAHALQFVSGADAAQVSVTRERSLVSRFARSTPTQATSVDDTGVHVLALREGHAGTAETNDLSDDGLRRAAARAVAAASAAATVAGEPGDHPGLPAPQLPAAHTGFDAATADPDAAAAGAALAAAFATCADHGVEAFGIWTSGRVTTALAATTGLGVSDDVTDAFAKVIARHPGTARSGWGATAGRAVADLDVPAAATRAAAGITGEEPRAIAPGAYTVVLAPDAVGGILDMLSGLAFNGRAHAEGRGALVDRLGTLVAAPIVTIADLPGHPLTLPRGFDAEGVAKRATPLISSGIADGVVHDTTSAALAGGGAHSTGHAVVAGGSPYGPSATNLVMAPGSAADEAELIAGVERGIYVTRLWYLNPVDEKHALLTGMTRDGTFWIEDGRIAGPARDVRFTDGALRILEATTGLTQQQRLVSEGEFYGRRFASGVVCPSLRAEGFAVSGATPG